jgi:hypothetical protein
MEDLLKPTGPNVKGRDGEMYVQLGEPPGALKVRDTLFEDFKKAETYLGQTKEGVDVMYQLSHPPANRPTGPGGKMEHPLPIEVRPVATVNGDQFHWGNDPGIDWAPTGGLQNKNGSTESPALMLAHETGHAGEWLNHPDRLAKDNVPYPVGSPDQKWTTPEERRNIEGLEHRLGKELGEGRRDDHYGVDLQTRGPDNRFPAYLDPKSVTVDGVGKSPSNAVNLEGTPTNIMHRNGITTVDFDDKRGAHRTLAFPDPIGKDAAGLPVDHPLHDMVDRMEKSNERGTMKLAIDGKGNFDYAVGNDKTLDRGHSGPGDPKDLAPNDPRPSSLTKAIQDSIGDPAHTPAPADNTRSAPAPAAPAKAGSAWER